MAAEEKPVPPPTFWDLIERFFHRQDELQGYMAETQRQLLEIVRALSGVAPPIPVAPGARIEVTAISEVAMKGLVQDLMKAPLAVYAYPLGKVKKRGSLSATTASYETVCEITVNNGKTFQLGNFSISADQDILCKLLWQDKQLTPVFLVMAKLPFDKFFLPEYYTDDGKPLLGDGKSKLQLQACYPTGGTASAYLEGEIVGNEV